MPEVFDSTYDVRTLLAGSSRLRDGEKLDLPGPHRFRSWLLDKLDETEIGELLTELGVIPDH